MAKLRGNKPIFHSQFPSLPPLVSPPLSPNSSPKTPPTPTPHKHRFFVEKRLRKLRIEPVSDPILLSKKIAGIKKNNKRDNGIRWKSEVKIVDKRISGPWMVSKKDAEEALHPVVLAFLEGCDEKVREKREVHFQNTLAKLLDESPYGNNEQLIRMHCMPYNPSLACLSIPRLAKLLTYLPITTETSARMYAIHLSVQLSWGLQVVAPGLAKQFIHHFMHKAKQAVSHIPSFPITSWNNVSGFNIEEAVIYAQLQITGILIGQVAKIEADDGTAPWAARILGKCVGETMVAEKGEWLTRVFLDHLLVCLEKEMHVCKALEHHEYMNLFRDEPREWDCALLREERVYRVGGIYDVRDWAGQREGFVRGRGRMLETSPGATIE